MSNMVSHGWGVIYRDKLEIRTVTDSAVGAKVNALGFLAGYQIMQGTSEHLINTMFAKLEQQHGVKLVRVQCEAIHAD